MPRVCHDAYHDACCDAPTEAPPRSPSIHVSVHDARRAALRPCSPESSIHRARHGHWLAWAIAATGRSLPPVCRSIRSPENESGIRGSPQMSGTECNLGEYDRSASGPAWARALIVPCPPSILVSRGYWTPLARVPARAAWLELIDREGQRGMVRGSPNKLQTVQKRHRA